MFLAANLEILIAIKKLAIPVIIITSKIIIKLDNENSGSRLEIVTAAPVRVLPIV